MEQKLKYALYTPHPGQLQVHNDPTRFRIVVCGRRWGKTWLAVNEIIKELLKNPGVGWWVAPVYQQSLHGYEIAVKNLNKLIKKKWDFLKRIELLNGSIIEFKSADNYENLRGIGLDFLVIDEAARVKREGWEQVLRPTLVDRMGRALFISTPKGKNWFYHLYLLGLGGDKQYKSFHFPSYTNPFLSRDEIESLRLTLPSDVYTQEIEAEFLDMCSSVFKNIRACVKGVLEEPQPGREYLIGWDPAKYQDFSVIIVMDLYRRHVVGFERLQQIDYSFQIQKIELIAKKYNNAKIIVDSTGVGDPLLEALERRGLDVEGVVLTNTSKKQLIENLSLGIEQQEISFPEIPVLLNELEIFEYQITHAGNVIYSAPEGYHDDCVLALALAYWGCREKREPLMIW